MKIAIILSTLLVSFVHSQSHLTGIDVSALPNASYQSDRGFKYGGRIHIIDYDDGTLTPFKWNFSLEASNTTKNQVESVAFLDVPHIFGPFSRFDIMLQYNRLLYDDYYGIGNDVADHSESPIKFGSSSPMDSRYHNFKSQTLALVWNIQLPLKDQLKILTGLGFYKRAITVFDPPSKLAQDSPVGMAGGYSNYIRLGMIYDTRNEETTPTQGVWSELLLEMAHSFLSSDYHYRRMTLTDRRYFAIFPNLVFAQRILFEVMPGNPPFYEMSVLGHSFKKQEGLGGVYSLRGIPRHLFIGPHKIVANFEMRFKVTARTILNQPLTFYVHAFSDAGRVWTDNHLKIDHFHTTRGAGIHVQWKKDVVGALDIGFSTYKNFAIYTSFGNLF